IDPATYQAAYDSAKAALAKAEAAEHVAELQLNRRKQLASSSVISQQEYDDALATLRQAQADVAAGKAALEEARINLEYTRVLSPISGIIGRSLVTEGALVTSQQPAPLAVVQQLDPMYVDVTQPISRLQRLRRELEAGTLKNPTPGEAPTQL